MMAYRPYRFPPLPQAASPALRAGDASAQWQTSLAQGYQKGQDDGYREGHQAGLVNGHAEGFSEGRKQGVQQGHEQARQEALASFDTLAKPIEVLLDKLQHMHADYQSAKRKEVVELVAKVARQVIRCELTLQPVQLLALVDETLTALPPVADGRVEVFLNPEELQRIREIDPKRFRKWTLLPDARLELGECRVRAGDHEVDAGCNQRLAACMEQVSTQLLEAADAGAPAQPTEAA